MCVSGLDKRFWPFCSAKLFWKFEWGISNKWGTLCVFSPPLTLLLGFTVPLKQGVATLLQNLAPVGKRQTLHRLPVDITAGKREDCVRHGTNTCKTDGLMFFVIPREGKRKSGNRIWAWQETIMTMLHKSVLTHFWVLIWFQKMFFL